MIGLLRTGTWDLDKGQGDAGKLRTEPLPLKFPAQGVNLTQLAQFPSGLLNWSLHLEKLNQRVKCGPDKTGVTAARYKTVAPLRKVDLSFTNSGGLLNTACHSLPPFLQPGARIGVPGGSAKEALMGPVGI